MTATTEASGLIDIRQLSAQMRSSSDEKKKSRVDDIMNLGGGAGFGPSLAAPTLAAPSLEDYARPPPEAVGTVPSIGPAAPRSRAVVFLALGAGTFLLVAAVGLTVLLVRGRGPTTADERERSAASASAAETTSLPSSPSAAASQVAQAPAAPRAGPPETATTSTPQVAAAAPTKETPKETAPKEAAPRAPAPAKEPQAGSASAGEFNMGEARARLASIASATQSCKRGEASGSGRVEIVFAPSGGVQSASLISGPPFEGTSTGTCVVARFKAARVPAFGGSPFTVTKSFNIN